MVNINVGTRVSEGGQSRVIGQKVAEFSAMADGFGRLVTDDPEIIAKLDARSGPESDVFDGTEYQKRTTPVEVRNKILEEKISRLVTDNNRLMAKLEQDGRLSAPASKGAPPSK